MSKSQRGITLVALIVTIVILLILAGITIPPIKKDGLISQTEGVANEFEIKQEKEDLQRLMVTTWQLEIQTKPNPDLKEFLEKKYGEGKVISNEDGTCILYLPSGNTCSIDESGNILWLSENDN